MRFLQEEEQSGLDKAQVHGNMLIIVWLAAANIGWIPIPSLVHKIFGWILLVLTVIQFCVIGKIALYLTISLVSWALFFLYKIFRPRMQNKPAISNLSESVKTLTASQVSSMLQDKKNYFIFADKVYDIDKVITSHPGGYELINNIRGREVDRFLYGSEPLETVDFKKLHSHTSNSIKLAGDPIAVLSSVSPFANMDDMNHVVMDKQLIMPCNVPYIYAPYLKSTSKNFEYKGYSQLSQIGKYFAVTIDEKKTRLYTMVNFLCRENLDLMSRITGSNYLLRRVVPSDIAENVNSAEQMKVLNENYGTSQQGYGSIPLLIKKYAEGHFTKQFLSSHIYTDEIKLSKPLGRGMGLNELPNGKIVMFAAGTGLNPFCDLIDLLFKQMIVGLKSVYSDQILKKNPIIVRRELTTRFKYCIYIAVPSTEEIHRITSQQLDQLSRNRVIQVYLRSTINSDNYFKQYPNIHKLNKRFEECIGDVVPEGGSISQIYVCGPPAMSRSMIQSFQRYQIPAAKVRVM